MDVVSQTNIEKYPVRRGKVRDIYDLGDELLLVATDRISAFDVVLPTPIPGKGALLTAISQFWFHHFESDVPHHFLEVVDQKAPAGLDAELWQLTGRTIRCRKTEVLPIEFVVRGYITGSGWKDYQRTGEICGIALPAGLEQCQQLPEPLFTPSTKATVGHDENVSFDQAAQVVGEERLASLRDLSIDLYLRASEHALDRGIIIADTKFEFGMVDGEAILIDEVLTPDSSRFWPADQYEPGREQESFDKQYVRNYLATLVEAGAWDKTPPGPELPEEIVTNTRKRYEEAVRRLTDAADHEN